MPAKGVEMGQNNQEEGMTLGKEASGGSGSIVMSSRRSVTVCGCRCVPSTRVTRTSSTSRQRFSVTTTSSITERVHGSPSWCGAGHSPIARGIPTTARRSTSTRWWRSGSSTTCSRLVTCLVSRQPPAATGHFDFVNVQNLFDLRETPRCRAGCRGLRLGRQIGWHRSNTVREVHRQLEKMAGVQHSLAGAIAKPGGDRVA